MFYQPSAGLHQPLLQARQRPLLDPLRQHQSPPEVAQIISNEGQPQPVRKLEEIRADILTLERETGGLLDEIIGGGAGS